MTINISYLRRNLVVFYSFNGTTELVEAVNSLLVRCEPEDLLCVAFPLIREARDKEQKKPMKCRKCLTRVCGFFKWLLGALHG